MWIDVLCNIRALCACWIIAYSRTWTREVIFHPNVQKLKHSTFCQAIIDPQKVAWFFKYYISYVSVYADTQLVGWRGCYLYWKTRKWIMNVNDLKCIIFKHIYVIYCIFVVHIRDCLSPTHYFLFVYFALKTSVTVCANVWFFAYYTTILRISIRNMFCPNFFTKHN